MDRFEEATLTAHGRSFLLFKNYFQNLKKKGKERVYIKKRKGFIKYALEFGYQIHPVYIFNENKLYSTFDKLTKYRL